MWLLDVLLVNWHFVIDQTCILQVSPTFECFFRLAVLFACSVLRVFCLEISILKSR